MPVFASFCSNWLVLFCLAAALTALPAQASAQSAEKNAPSDTLPDDSAHHHSPRRAILLSAVVPGMGQIYNKKYWKLPIIYGAGGAFAYFVSFNQIKYIKFRNALATSQEGETVLIDGRLYPYSVLSRGQDYYRRYRDLSVLGLGLIYFLNVVDAMVDAHFVNYDISGDLSFHVRPALIPTNQLTAATGITLQIRF